MLQRVLSLQKYEHFKEVGIDDYRDTTKENPGFSISSKGWANHNSGESGKLIDLIPKLESKEIDVHKIYSSSIENDGIIKRYYASREIEIEPATINQLACKVLKTKTGHNIYTPLRFLGVGFDQLHYTKLNENCEIEGKKKIFGKSKTKSDRAVTLTRGAKKCLIVEGVEDGVILFQEMTDFDVIVSVTHTNFNKVDSFLNKYEECFLILDNDETDNSVRSSLKLGDRVKRLLPKNQGEDANKAWIERCELDSWFNELEELDYSELLEKYGKQDVAEKPQSKEVDYIYMGARGKVLSTIENFKALIKHIGLKINYDVIGKEAIISGANLPKSTYDNQDNTNNTYIVSEANRLGFPEKNVHVFSELLADNNAINPVLEWVKSKPWDGDNHILQLADTVTTEDGFETEFKNTLIRRWLLSAVYMLQNENGNRQSKGVLVFQGKQNVGKTRWFNRLLPKEMSKYSKESVVLDPKDKDSVISAVSHWLVELGELEATFRKSDIAQLKAFISSTVDKLRRPYAKKDSKFPRRTTFFASVNDGSFLKDETGNSRYWCLPVINVDYEHNIDMQQVFAQCLVLVERGEQHWLNDDENEKLTKSNNEFEEIDPLIETLISNFNWRYVDGAISRSQEYGNKMTASEVCSKLGLSNVTRRETTKVGAFLRGVLGKPKKNNGRTVWAIPDLNIIYENSNK